MIERIFVSLPLYSRLPRSNTTCNTLTSITPLSTVLTGLQNPHMNLEPKKKEVYGVVAIIHLAIVGDRMREKLGSNFSGDAELTQALKSLKQKRVFKTPSSVKLLELRITYYHNSFDLLRISMLLPTPKVGMKRIFQRMRLGTCFSPALISVNKVCSPFFLLRTYLRVFYLSFSSPRMAVFSNVAL